MGEDNKSPDSLSFDERLKRAQEKAKGATPSLDADTPPNSPMGIAFKMGIELVVGSGVGAFIGYWFDKWLGTAPVFLVLLLILGFAAGVRNVVRDAIRMQEADEAAEADKD